MNNMDYDERLRALQKAYAEMILNCSKEAAAKVMVADRRTLKFQHELNSTKEHAVQMMLRLKQMMESKVKEAGVAYFNQQQVIEELKAQLQGAEDRIIEVETACLSQQRKIDVLEAQLGEAEDIVTELREELRKERTEAKSAGNSEFQLMGEHDTSTQDPPPQKKKSDASRALVSSPALPVVSSTPKKLHQQNTNSDLQEELRKERTELKSAGNSRLQLMGEHDSSTQDPPPQEKKSDASPALVSSPALPVVSLTPKKPCQQNIDSVPPPESQLENLVASGIKSSSVNPSVEIRLPSVPSIVLGNKGPEPYRNRRTQRIRAFEEKLMAGELSFVETTDAATYQTRGREDRKRKTSEKRDVAQLPLNSFGDRTTLGSIRKKIRKSRKNPKQGLKKDLNVDICTEKDSASKNALTDGDAPRLSEDMSEKGTVSECTEEVPDAFGVDSARDKDRSSSMDNFSVKGQEIQSPDNSELPIRKMDDEKTVVPTETSLVVSTSNGVPVMTSNGRIIKYTFQRKRKRGALSNSDGNTSIEQDSSKKNAAEDEQNSPTKRRREAMSNSDGNTSVEQDSSKKNAVDEQNSPTKWKREALSNGNTSLEQDSSKKNAASEQNSPTVMEKCSNLKGSSRDSRRLAVVAHQLISMSENNW